MNGKWVKNIERGPGGGREKARGEKDWRERKRELNICIFKRRAKVKWRERDKERDRDRDREGGGRERKRGGGGVREVDVVFILYLCILIDWLKIHILNTIEIIRNTLS